MSPGFISCHGHLVTLLGRRDDLLRVMGLVKDSMLPSSRGLILRVTHIVHLNFLRRGTFRPSSAYISVRGRFLVVSAVLCLCGRTHALIAVKRPVSMLGSRGVFSHIVTVGCSIPGGHPRVFTRCRESVSTFCRRMLRGGTWKKAASYRLGVLTWTMSATL